MEEMFRNRKALILTLTAVGVIALDIFTKRWALRALNPGETIPALRGVVPLTLALNEGAAFSINLGPASRWVFLVLSTIALGALFALYWNSERGDTLRLFAISLVSSGAIGNLIDRARWDRGVVDFIGPINLGLLHWPIFNVADMAITCGAVLLALSLWQEGSAAAEPAPIAPLDSDAA
jgi:signal peptidase II